MRTHVVVSVFALFLTDEQLKIEEILSKAMFRKRQPGEWTTYPPLTDKELGILTQVFEEQFPQYTISLESKGDVYIYTFSSPIAGSEPD